MDDHDDIMKPIKKFNAKKEKLKNKVEREKEEEPIVEIVTTEDRERERDIYFPVRVQTIHIA